MTKKYGKDTFRRSKKKILHKKRVNSKKRGLRGGGLMSLFRSSASQPQVDNQIHGIHGSALRDSMKQSMLTATDCTGLLGQIISNPKKTLTSNAKTEVRLCKQKFYSDLKVKFPTPDSMEGVEYFDTQLSTNSNPDQKLTLRNCKVLKNPIHPERLERLEKLYEYRIFSPAVSTLPPIGGIQEETPVGTFTQFPVSALLIMAGNEIPFSFASFYGSDTTRKSYFSDYLSCLKNVKEKFGTDVLTAKDIFQFDKFSSSSKLRDFGKSEECKIVLVAGNIGTKIQDPSNKGAIVVTPSQFSGTEYLDPVSGPNTTLDGYKQDPTGGPLAQLSVCPPVAKVILLHGARKLSDGSDFTSDFLVINAIDDVISELSTRSITSLTLNNGYLEVPSKLQSGEELDLTDDSENPPETAITIFDSLSQKLKMLQTDDVPTNGLTPPGIYTEFNSQSTSKVTLIYASAVPLNYTLRSKINIEKSMLQYCVAGFNLVAQYFGSMVSAYNKSKKPGVALDKKVKLFLTPLGGGVFKNPREMIASSVLLAYYQAKKLFSDFDAKVEVIFLAWDGNQRREKFPHECSDFSEFFKFSTTDKETTRVINEEGMQKKLEYQGILEEMKNERLQHQKERENNQKYPEVTASERLMGNTMPEISVDTTQAQGALEDNRESLNEAESNQNVNTSDEGEGQGDDDDDVMLPPRTKTSQPATMLGDELFENYKDLFEVKPVEKQLPNVTIKLQGESLNNHNVRIYRDKIIQKYKSGETIILSYKNFNIRHEWTNEELSELFNFFEMTYISDASGYVSNLKKMLFIQMIFIPSECGEDYSDSFFKCAELSGVNTSAQLGLKDFFSQKRVNILTGANNYGGGSKSRRTHRHKPVRKTTRKSKSKTHRRRRNSRTRKHKKYTRKR